MHALLDGSCGSEKRMDALAKLDSRLRGNDGLAVFDDEASLRLISGSLSGEAIG